MLTGALLLLPLLAMLLLTAQIRRLASRIRALERQLLGRELPERGSLPTRESPLRGYRVALHIDQDHPHPVFANLLKEMLLGEDALPDAPDPQLLIEGRVLCNGYADVYYTAELTCQLKGEPICVLIEKPPHGDRQENLARELLAKLTKELGKTARRTERHAALRELGDP